MAIIFSSKRLENILKVYLNEVLELNIQTIEVLKKFFRGIGQENSEKQDVEFQTMFDDFFDTELFKLELENQELKRLHVVSEGELLSKRIREFGQEFENSSRLLATSGDSINQQHGQQKGMSLETVVPTKISSQLLRNLTHQTPGLSQSPSQAVEGKSIFKKTSTKKSIKKVTITEQLQTLEEEEIMVVKREDMIFEKIAPISRSLKHQIDTDPILLKTSHLVSEQIPVSVSENLSSLVQATSDPSSSELRTHSPIRKSSYTQPKVKGKRGRKKKAKLPAENAHQEEFVVSLKRQDLLNNTTEPNQETFENPFFWKQFPSNFGLQETDDFECFAPQDPSYPNVLIEHVDEEQPLAPNFMDEANSNYFLVSNDLNLMDKSQTSLEEYLPNLQRTGSCNQAAIEQDDNKDQLQSTHRRLQKLTDETPELFDLAQKFLKTSSMNFSCVAENSFTDQYSAFVAQPESVISNKKQENSQSD